MLCDGPFASLDPYLTRLWLNVWVPFFLRVFWLRDRLTDLLDYPQMSFLSTLNAELVRDVLDLLAAMLTCAGLFHATQSFSTDYEIHLFESLYFVVVTFGTIGFGDIVPTTMWSRLLACGIMLYAVYKFPTFFTRLTDLAKQRYKFAEFDSRHGGTKHVIVAGRLEDRDIAFVLNEFVAGARKVHVPQDRILVVC